LAASGTNANCWLYDFLAWTYIPIESAKKLGETNRCRVGVGIPFGKGAANGGQVAVEIVSQKLQSALSQYPILKERFGGMFGWDEYWDTRSLGGWGYGESQVAKDLGIMLKGASFQKTLNGQRRTRRLPALRGSDEEEAQQRERIIRALSGENAGSSQCKASYAKDWTLGGKVEGGAWKSNCGCKKVPYTTEFTDVLGCIDSWSNGNSATSCARIEAGTSEDDIQRSEMKESSSDGTDDEKTGPAAVQDTNSKTGVSVTTASGKVVEVASLPQRVGFTLKLTFSKQAASCEDLQQVEPALRKMMCNAHRHSYKALGYSDSSKTSTLCGRSKLIAEYGGKEQRRTDCDDILASASSEQSSSTMVSRSLSTEEDNVLYVRATFHTAYPAVVPEEEEDVQQYVGHQLAAAEMIAQQLRTMNEAELITSQFDTDTSATLVVFDGSIATGPDVNHEYNGNTTGNTTLCNVFNSGVVDTTLPMCTPWVQSTAAIVLFCMLAGLCLCGCVAVAFRCSRPSYKAPATGLGRKDSLGQTNVKQATKTIEMNVSTSDVKKAMALKSNPMR